METGPGNAESILDQARFRRLIEDREIRPEDLHLIEELAKFPKNLVNAELHNFFNLNQDRSGRELERQISVLEHLTPEERKWRDEALVEQKIALFRIVLEFYDRYEKDAAYHLVRILDGSIK